MMSQNYCTLCEAIIDDQNYTEEHIIPNSIGGFKKVSKFICRNCNSKKGETWDNQLSKHFELCCLLINIKRERGKVQPQIITTESGISYKLYPDGHMENPNFVYKKIENNSSTIIHMEPRPNEIKKKIKEIKNKYPQVKDNDISIKTYSEYTSENFNLSFSFNINEIEKSAIKSILALLSLHNVEHSRYEQARLFLTHDQYIPISTFYDTDIIINRPTHMPLHCIYVKGDPNLKKILGYVEYFGFARIIICLSNSYCGDIFEYNYSIDPTSSNELDLQFNLNLNAEQLSDIFKVKHHSKDFQKIIENFTLVMHEAQKRSFTRDLENVLERAKNAALQKSTYLNISKDDILTEHQKNLLIEEMATELDPFLKNVSDIINQK